MSEPQKSDEDEMEQDPDPRKSQDQFAGTNEYVRQRTRNYTGRQQRSARSVSRACVEHCSCAGHEELIPPHRTQFHHRASSFQGQTRVADRS